MAYIPGATPDDSAFTEGASGVTVVGGVYQPTLADLTAGQSAALRVTQRRAAHTNLRDGSGNEIGTSILPLRVDPTGGTAQPIKPCSVTLQDISGTIATDATAQLLADANAGRIYLLIQNVSDADLWFNFTTAAVADQPSIRLPMGSPPFVMEASIVSTEAIWIIGASAGQAYTAKQCSTTPPVQTGFSSLFAFWIGGGGA